MTRHTITRCDRPLGVGARSKRLLAAARPESTLLWDTGRLKATPVKVPQSRRRCGGVLVYALGSRAHTTAWTAAGAELERIRTGRRMHASFSSSSSTPLAAAQQLARIRLAAAAVPRQAAATVPRQAAATVPRQAAAADAAIRLPRPAAALTAAADAPIRRLVNVSSLSPSAARLCLSGRLPLAHPCSSTKVRAPATAAPAYAPSYELHGGQDSRSPGLARAPLLACTSSSSGGARAQEVQAPAFRSSPLSCHRWPRCCCEVSSLPTPSGTHGALPCCGWQPDRARLISLPALGRRQPLRGRRASDASSCCACGGDWRRGRRAQGHKAPPPPMFNVRSYWPLLS